VEGKCFEEFHSDHNEVEGMVALVGNNRRMWGLDMVEVPGKFDLVDMMESMVRLLEHQFH
jgi:hypothetical protein